MKKEAFEDQVNRVLANWKTPKLSTNDELWQNLLYAISEGKSTQPAKSKTWPWVVAASLFLVFLTAGTFIFSNQTLLNTGAAKQTVLLPDGSKVVLHTNSQISYNSLLWPINRTASLKGEAFFKVTKGSVFTVKTPSAQVQVLGTSFVVNTRPGQFNVHCYTGKVAVANKSNKVILTPGHQAFFSSANHSKLITKQVESSQRMPAWAGDSYTYTNEKLTKVLKDIETQYGVSFTYKKSLHRLSFTGEWNSSMRLDEVLQIVCLPFNLEAEKLDKNSFTIEFINAK